MDTPVSVRTIARKEGIDLGSLLHILSQRRPDGSQTEEQFVVDTLDTIEGMEADDYGNRYIRIGTAPVMWSCHTDTVSKDGGQQNLKWDGDVLALNQGKPGQSLGADDGAGLWLMLEMIKARREGLYIFHRAEEIGGLGSKHIAKTNPELVDGIKMAIAFDRKATTSVITFQRSQRCCSDKFGKALAAALNTAEGLEYKLDTGGVFTDTASYTSLIPECTNLSAGYYKEHGPTETLDVAHLFRLREALLTLDVTNLPIERDPSKVEYDDSWGPYSGMGFGGYGRNWGAAKKDYRNTELDESERMRLIISERPYTVAQWFQNAGIGMDMLEILLNSTWSNQASVPALRTGLPVLAAPPAKEWKGALADQDLAGHEEVDEQYEDAIEMLHCEDCKDVFEPHFSYPRDGDQCPECGQVNTIAVEVDPTSGEVLVDA